MKNNSNIDSWIRQAFEKAGEQASAMEVVVENIGKTFNEKSGDILDAWAEISDGDCIADLVEEASEDEVMATTLENLMKMGVIAGYLAALDDIRNERLNGFV